MDICTGITSNKRAYMKTRGNKRRRLLQSPFQETKKQRRDFRTVLVKMGGCGAKLQKSFFYGERGQGWLLSKINFTNQKRWE